MANKTHSSILKLNTSCPNLYNAEKEKEINHIGTLIANMRSKKGLSLVKFSALLEQYGVKIKTFFSECFGMMDEGYKE